MIERTLGDWEVVADLTSGAKTGSAMGFPLGVAIVIAGSWGSAPPPRRLSPHVRHKSRRRLSLHLARSVRHLKAAPTEGAKEERDEEELLEGARRPDRLGGRLHEPRA